jgi:hypothetical protein
MERELQRRLQRVEKGQDPYRAYQAACEAVRASHAAFKNSKDRQGRPSPHASDVYARSLRELDLSTRVLQITQALQKAS